jgi:hypothetical protein
VDSSVPAVVKQFESEDANIKFYNCFLVSGDNPKGWRKLKDSNITSAAIVFRVVATGGEGSKLKNGTTTVRIEHRTPDGRRLYFKYIHDAKPK